MIKRLPQFAERHFGALCASAGVVCNKSEEDECGWDFFLQFPTKYVFSRPADMHPAAPEALVQVKSTRTAPLVARMKLSNALRLVKSPHPCFVILVEECSDGPRIFGAHFWQHEIARTLKRVREAERDGVTEMHKRSFNLRMREADAHDEPLEWMRRVIEGIVPNYFEAKSKIVNTVGHEDGFGSMEMQIEGTTQDMLNLQLGLIDSLPIMEAKYFPQRFGIKAAHPEFEIERAQLFVTPVSRSVRLRLQGGSPTEEFFVDASLYSAELPNDEMPIHSWRVVAGPLHLIGGNGVYKVKLSIDYEAKSRISELNLFLILLDWQGVGPVGLQLFFEDKQVPLGALTYDSTDNKSEWSRLRGWAAALETVANAAHSTEPEISLLEMCDGEPWLSRFAGFVMSPSLRIEYEPQELDDPTRAAIYYVGCNVGELCFLAVVERNTKSDEMEGSRRVLTFGPPQLLDAITRRGNWHDHRDEIDAAYREQLKRLGALETLWEIGEFESFIKRASQEAA